MDDKITMREVCFKVASLVFKLVICMWKQKHCCSIGDSAFISYLMKLSSVIWNFHDVKKKFYFLSPKSCRNIFKFIQFNQIVQKRWSRFSAVKSVRKKHRQCLILYKYLIRTRAHASSHVPGASATTAEIFEWMPSRAKTKTFGLNIEIEDLIIQRLNSRQIQYSRLT